MLCEIRFIYKNLNNASLYAIMTLSATLQIIVGEEFQLLKNRRKRSHGRKIWPALIQYPSLLHAY